MAHEQQRRWRQPRDRQAPGLDPRDVLARAVRGGTPTRIDSEALEAEAGYQAANERQKAALDRLTSLLSACRSECTCGAVARTLATDPSQEGVGT